MYCPECGNDAGDAKFCPECGANLAGVKDALSGKPAARPAKQPDVTEAAPAAGPADGGPRKLSPAVVWGAFGALAIVVIIVVVMVSGGFGGGTDDSATEPATAGVAAVEADTSGSYEELVQRANDLYDQGDAAFRDQSIEQGGAYFAAAAKVYAAAWAKQATDPAVGTDYAVALFYSGDIAGAIDQVDQVLEANPDFQKGWLNKGIFLSHEGQIAKQGGEAKQATKHFAEARRALTRAVALDPKSEAGQQADEFMASLPE